MKRQLKREVALAVLGAIVGYSLISNSSETAKPTYNAAIGVSPIGGFTVSGKQILDGNKHAFTPYGVHIIALYSQNWRTSWEYKNWSFAEMQAARYDWSSNIVDFQITSTSLFPDASHPTTADAQYVAQLDQAVLWANQLGMAIIFNLQTETTTNEKMAIETSIPFWTFMANRYKANLSVFFDLFNEPRLDGDSSLAIWKNGGVQDGVTYVGMQKLVDTVRATGAQNIVIAQGEGSGESLSGLPNNTLSGVNIVYAVHPYLSDTQHRTVADWNDWFGNASKVVNAPFIVDEWNLAQSPNAGCMPDGPSVAQQFIAYDEQMNFGMIGWALYPGSLIRADSQGNWQWNVPTAFDGTWPSCTGRAEYPDLDPDAQGAGALIMQLNRTHATWPTVSSSLLP